MRTQILALALLAAAAAPSVAAPEQELQRFFDSVKTLSANFEQTQTDEQGKVVQKSRGTMLLARPGRFRWEQQAPYAQLIVCDGTTLWIHDPDLSQASKRPAAEVLEGTPAALLAQGAALSQQFALEDGGADGDARVVRLKPKAPDSDFKSIELALAAGVPSRMTFDDQLGGHTEVRFTDVKVNGALAPARFAFAPPAGTEIVEAAPERSR